MFRKGFLFGWSWGGWKKHSLKSNDGSNPPVDHAGPADHAEPANVVSDGTIKHPTGDSVGHTSNGEIPHRSSQTSVSYGSSSSIGSSGSIISLPPKPSFNWAWVVLLIVGIFVLLLIAGVISYFFTRGSTPNVTMTTNPFTTPVPTPPILCSSLTLPRNMSDATRVGAFCQGCWKLPLTPPDSKVFCGEECCNKYFTPNSRLALVCYQRCLL